LEAQFGQDVGAIEVDGGDGVVLGEVQKRNRAGVENRLHGIDVGGGVGADGPVGEHLVSGVRFGGALDLGWIGLVDSAGGEAPQGGGAEALVLSPTTANSSAHLPRPAGSRPAACAPALNAASSFGFLTSRAWVIQPSPY